MKNMRNNQSRIHPLSASRDWWAVPAGFLIAMLAVPATAGIDIPNEPLTTGSRVPANLMFVLDNSTSMTQDPGITMANPDLPTICRRTTDGSSCRTSPSGMNITDASYTGNTIFFNPATQYQPWLTAVPGVRLASRDYTDASSHTALASGSIDLSNSVRTFYVPKDPTSSDLNYLGNTLNYYRYQILNNLKVVVSELTDGGSATGPTQEVEVIHVVDLRANRNAWAREGQTGTDTNNRAPNNAVWSFEVPSGASNLTAEIAGSDNDADVYIRQGERPERDQGSNNDRRCSATGGTSNESCTVTNPDTGTWYAAVRAGNSANSDSFADVRLTVRYSILEQTALGCSTSSSGWAWRNCAEVSNAAEIRQNFANWYSFHRTRMKAAKAGASEAFSRLGEDVRVGFRTINTGSGNSDFDIPVDNNGGVFVDIDGSNNRSAWYDKLHGATATGSTPLRTALNRAGQYFMTDAPYASGTDEPLSCRQNFTILTTDGFWNGSFSRPSGMDANSDGTDGPNGYVAEAPFSDSWNDTLADIAMHYWKRDLRPGMPNNVPSTPANWQHMVTFGISIGLKGTLDQSSVAEVVADGGPRKDGVPVSWPQPAANSVNNIDDLLHAAVNSRGQFVAAANPTEFADGLSAALASIEERVGSFSNVAANSTTLDTGARVFQASYVAGVWTGELKAQPVTLEGGIETVDCTLPGNPVRGWCASKKVPVTGRKVFTSNSHNDGTTVTVGAANQPALAFPSQATAEQLASLERLGPALPDPVAGAENAAYIAGDRSKELNQEGGTLRNRNHLLGDIVSSSPAYVQDTDTIFVGSNDGMLHALDAATGAELFAFIPGIVNWNALGTLSRPQYAHRYFVDGPIVVTSQQQTPGKNILVGALGKGGRGLFALDVTNPSGFGTGNNVKWEVAATPEGHMGLVQGRPVLARVKASGGTNAVILGNGLNSQNDRAALIVLDLNTGSVIREIDTGAGSDVAPNGLSAPVGIYGPDGRTVADVYAGDMLGNVWKFDLTDENPEAWSVAKLFEASVEGQPQPITGGLTVATHPVTNKRWVFFGTGRYLTMSDVGDESVQSMYGFMDDGTEISRSGAGANLTQRVLTITDGLVNGYPARAFQERAALPVGSKGWFIDLPVAGERIVQDAQLVSTFLVTASMIPSGDACEADGSGYINAFDAFTGTSAGGSYFDLDGDGATDDTALDGLPVGSVNLGVGMPTLPNLTRGRVFVGGSRGGSEDPLTSRPRWDRASWREIRGD